MTKDCRQVRGQRRRRPSSKLLTALWDRGRSTARELTEIAYGRTGSKEIGPAQKRTCTNRSCTNSDGAKAAANAWRPRDWLRRDRAETRTLLRGGDLARPRFAGSQLEQLAEKADRRVAGCRFFSRNLVEAKKAVPKRTGSKSAVCSRKAPPRKKPGERK